MKGGAFVLSWETFINTKLSLIFEFVFSCPFADQSGVILGFRSDSVRRPSCRVHHIWTVHPAHSDISFCVLEEQFNACPQLPSISWMRGGWGPVSLIGPFFLRAILAEWLRGTPPVPSGGRALQSNCRLCHFHTLSAWLWDGCCANCSVEDKISTIIVDGASHGTEAAHCSLDITDKITGWSWGGKNINCRIWCISHRRSWKIWKRANFALCNLLWFVH